jgi:hypothetical protein
MKRFHGILTIVISLAMAVLVGAAGLMMFWPRLPDPATADREGLFRWLLTRDMSEQSPEIQLALARRLEQELMSGLDFRQSVQDLNEAQRGRLWDNIRVLMKPWFMHEVDDYHRFSNTEQSDLVDRFLDVLAALQGLESLLPGQAVSPDPPASQSDLMRTLMGQVDQWKAEVSAQQREQIDKFLSAVKMRWLMRSLKRKVAVHIMRNMDGAG